jgi:transposase
MKYKLDFGFQGRNNGIKKKMDKDLLLELRGKGWSKRRIAKYLDCGASTVGRWMVKFGVD